MRQKNCNQVYDHLFQSGQVSFVIFILCLSFCNCTTQPPTETPELLSATKTICHHLLPGLHKLRRGVDITKLDLLPLKVNSDDGFKYPVIDFNCADGKTQYIGESVYNVPDEIFTVTPMSKGLLNEQVNIVKKSSDVLKMMSANIGFDTVIKGLFSASSSYKKMTSSFYNESRYVEHVVAHQSVSRASLIPKFFLKLGKYAQLYVDKFLPIKKVDTKFTASSNQIIRYYGGDTNLLVSGGIAKWQPTVAKNPWVFGGQLVPLDGDGGQCGGGAARNLCAKVGTMTTYYRDDTDKRGGGCRMKWGIMKPGRLNESWLKQVQICYNWWPDGDGGQCGGGAARNLCAPINQFTAVYRDDTDRRGGGCRMRWKLVVPSSAPIWLKNMKLCFQWYPDGDAGQCGGGVDRLLCATANSWTTAYRDDTDRRGGGCRMRWGLIPS
ncbi:unnamed protein product [Acanthosepion pharaonis]|uniref:Uncharacterized protein n=1 Tax=Acanthosepion pharaonis TaxID=158019 RepID=A0A812CCA6_ACAPH|nr:unnamed protein product [Sepia pharaonis]